MPKRQEQQNEKKEISLNAPETCLACHTANVATFPVHLTEFDGSVTLVCHVARCTNCGYIKNYGLYKGIFKLTSGRPDFGMKYWPELKRNDITPDAFIDAVCEAAKDKNRTIWLDARNGLLQAEPSENAKKIMQRWEKLTNEKFSFV